MLILTRKPGQALTIRPLWQLDPSTPVEQLFCDGAIRISVTAVRGPQVRLGVVAHPGFHILREELLTTPKPGLLPETTRLVLARKLRVVRLLRRLSGERLAQMAGLSLTGVTAAESGAGVVYLDDVEKMARVLNVAVSELFREPGVTPEERVVLALLEEVVAGPRPYEY